MIQINNEQIDSNIQTIYNSQGTKTSTNKFEKNKLKNIAIIICIIIIITMIGITAFLYNKKPGISKIEITDYNEETDIATIKIKTDTLFNETKCYLSTYETDSFDNKEQTTSENNICTFKVSINDYYIYLSKQGSTSKTKYLLSDYFDKSIAITTDIDKLYLAVGQEETITARLISLNQTEENLNWEVENNEIISVNNGLITALQTGSTIIKIKSKDGLEKDITVIVTDLISAPIIDNSRAFLKCKQYSNEDALTLDDILKTKIENKGYKTRAGVVEAARFLTLEFPYRVNYFIETGRLNNYDKIDFVDGEGRYYHQGLYLSEDKYNILKASKNGPAMWGCDLTQGDGLLKQNGFDCSGFVTWVLYNGGFDVKDTGAGYTDRTDDVSDLGQSHSITMDFLKSGQIKAGDLIGSNGHAAIIAAIDDNNIYVAESLYYNTGVSILKYSFEELTKTTKFSYISLMDSVYQKDGNYTAMWQ